MKKNMLAILLLTGCAASPMADDSGRVACRAFKPITYSMLRDTMDTVQQVREHNAAYQALCK